MPPQLAHRPRWHRNPRVHRFDLRLPDLGLEKIWLIEAFFEYSGVWHVHPFVQVVVVLQDGLRLEFEDGGAWDLEPGDGAVIGAGVRHCAAPCANSRRMVAISMLVSSEPVNPLHNWLTRSTPCWRWTCDPVTLAASAHQLDVLAHEAGPLHPARVMHAVWGLMVPHGAPALPKQPATPAMDEADAGVDKRILYIESLMRSRCSDAFDAERLAQSLQLSVSQMNRLFKLHRNSTPLRVLQRIRVEEAQRYLVNSSLTAKQIASRCGFVNAVHFAKLFKQAYHMSPRAYRAAAMASRPGELPKAVDG